MREERLGEGWGREGLEGEGRGERGEGLGREGGKKGDRKEGKC